MKPRVRPDFGDTTKPHPDNVTTPTPAQIEAAAKALMDASIDNKDGMRGLARAALTAAEVGNDQELDDITIRMQFERIQQLEAINSELVAALEYVGQYLYSGPIAEKVNAALAKVRDGTNAT